MPKHGDYAGETRSFDLELALAVANGTATSDYFGLKDGVVIYAPSGDVEAFIDELVLDGIFDEDTDEGTNDEEPSAQS